MITNTKRYLSILPGETKAIKKSAKITNVINYGSVGVVSTCGALPVAENALCYKLTISFNSNNGNALAAPASALVGVEIMNQNFLANINFGPRRAIHPLMDAFFNKLPKDIFKVTGSIYNDLDGNTDQYIVYFQTIPVVAQTIKAKVVGTGYEDFLYIFPKLIDCSPSS